MAAITITKHLGREDFFWTLLSSQSKEGDQGDHFIELYRDDVTHNQKQDQSTKCYGKFPFLSSDSSRLETFLSNLLLSIVLENGAEDDYRVTICLHRSTFVFTKHPNSTLAQEASLHMNDVTDEDLFFNKCKSYEVLKKDYYDSILCSYSWYHDRYEDYASNEKSMFSCIQRLVSCFMYMNFKVNR